ncbi:MAG: hypothetical protein K2F82_07065, partial [Muribaculaceae bacterium]|nr:hypothetical protein [Muribaculaceae bacterium]
VPELLMHKCTPLEIVRQMVPLLPGHKRHAVQQAGYAEIRRRLGTSDAAANAASIIFDDLRPGHKVSQSVEIS